MFDPNITPVHFHEASILEMELQQAGFQDIQTIPNMAEFVYADADEWWNVQWSHVNRAVLESIHPDVLTDFREEIFLHLKSIEEPDGIHQCFSVSHALAKKPEVGTCCTI
jgi:O-methyltransferase / aklanonic acid methyltransferase